ncbi:MAG: DUF4198 domain-containing protein [Gemmatimonadales bacterium]
MWKRSSLVLVLATATAAALFAHDLFLKLETYFVPPETPIRVAVLNGCFSSSEGAVTPDRLLDLSVAGPVDRRTVSRDAWKPAGDTTWLTIRTGAPGTYVLGASLAPREISLSAEDFNSYLALDGIPDILEARTRRGELARPAQERYHKHVKAILQVGATRTNAFETRFGYPAELVPLVNPYGLHVGDTLAIRCLVDGQPEARQLVIAGGEHDGQAQPERQARSDEEGVVRFVLGSTGKWYVKFIHMEPATGPGVDYESKWATLTFEVR